MASHQSGIPASSRPSPIPPILVIGFGSAVSMWVVWLITHFPAFRLESSIAGPLLLGVMTFSIAMGTSAVPRQRLAVGLGAGLLAGAINLLILGSQIVDAGGGAPAPGVEGLKPNAPAIIAGFLGLSAAVGLIGGFAAGRSDPDRRTDPARWLGRFAVIAVVAAVPLLLLGGLVTSTGSGLAVPDWPGTYGANMFLYPIGLMSQPQVYLEHTHRLFGALVGLSTLVLMVYVLVADRRPAVRAAAVILFLAVCLQGYLGGARVVEKSQWFAVMHGVLAQVFFGGLVALAAALSPSFRSATPAGVSLGRSSRLAAALVACIFVQLAFGAMYRHLHNNHALWSHAGFSLAVVLLAMLTAFNLSARLAPIASPGNAPARVARAARGLVHAVGFQFLLGWVAFYFALSSGKRHIPTSDQLADAPDIAWGDSLIRTIHQANGALLLALAVVCLVWSLRLNRPASPAQA
ncbi:MAG: COX15/CtaA family protein [Phycisphaerae bacterium]|nr:COX15/CtaA family protein [Phycisphaerae bacterium]